MCIMEVLITMRCIKGMHGLPELPGLLMQGGVRVLREQPLEPRLHRFELCEAFRTREPANNQRVLGDSNREEDREERAYGG